MFLTSPVSSSSPLSLPAAWQGYAFQFHYRGRVIRVSVQPGKALVELLEVLRRDLDEFLVALANCVQERIFEELPRGRAFGVFRD